MLKRRQFLTAAATIGTGVLILPRIRLFGAEAPSNQLNLAVVGCGGQGRGDMGGLLSEKGVNLVALCDPDPAQIQKARADAAGRGGDRAKGYEDYRRLLDDAATFDAVLIATPDHWHAPLSKAFMQAGKHVYCEKPLTHSVAEAREIREVARSSKVVTQMGNQGSASASLRRCVEVIRAGALGQIREIHQWGICGYAHEGNAPGEDPVPAGFNWDLWVGPSAPRPFNKVYHPANWRGWYDFGNGGLADFWCHASNLPLRALNLGYPRQLVVNIDDAGSQPPNKPAVEFHFPARGELAPLTIFWQGCSLPPEALLAPVVDVHKEKDGGVLLVGEKGCIHTSHWNTDALIRLEGEPRLKDILNHPATKDIPESLPRVGSHGREWVDACRGVGRTYSDFDIGGKLTEIGLAGVAALRARKNLDWDGEKMEATNAPEAARFIRPEHRQKWLV